MTSFTLKSSSHPTGKLVTKYQVISTSFTMAVIIHGSVNMAFLSLFVVPKIFCWVAQIRRQRSRWYASSLFVRQWKDGVVQINERKSEKYFYHWLKSARMKSTRASVGLLKRLLRGKSPELAWKSCTLDSPKYRWYHQHANNCTVSVPGNWLF